MSTGSAFPESSGRPADASSRFLPADVEEIPLTAGRLAGGARPMPAGPARLPGPGLPAGSMPKRSDAAGDAPVTRLQLSRLQEVGEGVSVTVSEPRDKLKADLGGLFDRRAGLLRELAGVDELLARAFESAAEPAELEDAVLSLKEAALFMGEPAGTFRRRPDYVRALVSRPTERRLRYSRAALVKIKRGRLEASEMFGGRIAV